MSYTQTRSQTSTFTEARARYVMEKVQEDLVALAIAGPITFERMRKLYDDLTYMAKAQALTSIDLKFSGGGGIRYAFSDNGTLLMDDDGGGLNLYGLPSSTTVDVVVKYGPKVAEPVRTEMRRRGWVSGGTLLEGDSQSDRTFSKDGYGAERHIFGDW